MSNLNLPSLPLGCQIYTLLDCMCVVEARSAWEPRAARNLSCNFHAPDKRQPNRLCPSVASPISRTAHQSPRPSVALHISHFAHQSHRPSVAAPTGRRSPISRSAHQSPRPSVASLISRLAHQSPRPPHQSLWPLPIACAHRSLRSSQLLVHQSPCPSAASPKSNQLLGRHSEAHLRTQSKGLSPKGRPKRSARSSRTDSSRRPCPRPTNRSTMSAAPSAVGLVGVHSDAALRRK